MVTVTILADNTVALPHPRGLRGEWGFSARVGDVLFDAGQSGAAAHNASLLGEPTDVETIVLSHAHFDHTAGLPAFLDRSADPTVYCHPGLWEPRYALGEIPRPHPDTAVGKVERGGELVDDPVIDDRALAVETGDGLGLILGCCHAGLLNTVEAAESALGDEVRYVAGGTHLVALDDEAVHAVADELEGRLDLFAGTHCTGFAAEAILQERFPGAFRSVGVGSTIELPP